MVVLPSTGFELTPLIHCSTIRLALRPAPKYTKQSDKELNTLLNDIIFVPSRDFIDV